MFRIIYCREIYSIYPVGLIVLINIFSRDNSNSSIESFKKDCVFWCITTIPSKVFLLKKSSKKLFTFSFQTPVSFIIVFFRSCKYVSKWVFYWLWVFVFQRNYLSKLTKTINCCKHITRTSFLYKNRSGLIFLYSRCHLCEKHHLFCWQSFFLEVLAELPFLKLLVARWAGDSALPVFLDFLVF